MFKLKMMIETFFLIYFTLSSIFQKRIFLKVKKLFKSPCSLAVLFCQSF